LNPAVIHVVYIGVDSNVHHFFGLFDSWNYENVSAQSGRAPASSGESPFGFSVDAETTLHINYRAADGNIWNLTRTVAGWQPREQPVSHAWISARNAGRGSHGLRLPLRRDPALG
jgi:hypothetical protein